MVSVDVCPFYEVAMPLFISANYTALGTALPGAESDMANHTYKGHKSPSDSASQWKRNG